MRLLVINGKKVDVDESTVIGVNIEGFNLSNLNNQSTTHSNTFTIPLTANNRNLIGNMGNPQSNSTKVYDELRTTYIVNNEKIINNALVIVKEISDRISLFVYEKKNIWQWLQDFSYPDFMNDLVLWLQSYHNTEYNLPDFENRFTGTWDEFVLEYTTNTEGVRLGNAISSLYGTLETEKDIVVFEEQQGEGTYQGTHFELYLTTVFKYIEYKFGVNFLTQAEEGEVLGNIWDIEYIKNITVFAPSIALKVLDLYGDISYYFVNANVEGLSIAEGGTDPVPVKYLNNAKDLFFHESKTLYDLVKGFIEINNLVIDNIIYKGEDCIRLAGFNWLDTLAETVNLSNKTTGQIKFSPTLSGIAQNNIINFAKVYEGGGDAGNKVLKCENKNLTSTKKYMTVGAYYPQKSKTLNVGEAVNLGAKKCYSEFTFLINDNSEMATREFVMGINITYTSSLLTVQKTQRLELLHNFDLLDTILTYPKVYEVEMWLSPEQVRNIKNFKLYYIAELGGTFYINSIKGYNPEKSKNPVTVELIFVNNRVATIPLKERKNLTRFTDNRGSIFVDGESNEFY